MKGVEAKPMPVTGLKRRNPEIYSLDTMVNVVRHAHKEAERRENLRYNRMIVKRITRKANKILDALTLLFSAIGLGFSIWFLIQIYGG